MSLFGTKVECPECGMKFASGAELRQHGAVHRESKPAVTPQSVSCPACRMFLRTSEELKAYGQHAHKMGSGPPGRNLTDCRAH